MVARSAMTGPDIVAQHNLTLSKRSLRLMSMLEAKTGAVVKPMSPPRASAPNVLIYKVMEKRFAIMAIRGDEGVILKCSEEQALFLREKYQGIGHRSHLDPRFWISVSLTSDVPPKQVERLVNASYDLVCAKLTKAQQAKLAAL